MSDNNIQPFPSTFGNAPQPLETEEKRKVRSGYLQALDAALDIASARVLGLIAVLGAVAMFGYAAYDPLPWRVYAAGAYAVVVLWPVVLLYSRKGQA